MTSSVIVGEDEEDSFTKPLGRLSDEIWVRTCPSCMLFYWSRCHVFYGARQHNTKASVSTVATRVKVCSILRLSPPSLYDMPLQTLKLITGSSRI
ncbi:hypothetical protein F2Q70_00024590 [Brassica cretica]|uniref:Uncharacterized protein n=1 Tax=Brassica cretica TaxID=69181 RepID=A0A8S9L8U0_BRACR|nr:hypothetical protein F2Q70_00024590 [Brassica cretica]